jgi:2-dehydro-3-deoxygluconokinase
MSGRIVAFGEIMGRLVPEGQLRLRQSLPGRLELTFAGAEANVAASVALLGGSAAFVSALPPGPLTEACLGSLRGVGVETRHILVRPDGRFSLYFVEFGFNQRPAIVTYDRDGSTFSRTSAECYAWSEILDGATWLHVTGITPALSAVAADATLAAVTAARERGISISCDMNFRTKLWRWRTGTEPRDLAREVMPTIVQQADLLIAGRQDGDILGVAMDQMGPEADFEADRCGAVAEAIAGLYPNLSYIATTLRDCPSVSHNRWGAHLYDVRSHDFDYAPQDAFGAYRPHDIETIVDRVGSDDAFAAALIFALNSDEFQSPRQALEFAVAASCLAHSVKGDFNFISRSEVENLANGILPQSVHR